MRVGGLGQSRGHADECECRGDYPGGKDRSTIAKASEHVWTSLSVTWLALAPGTRATRTSKVGQSHARFRLWGSQVLLSNWGGAPALPQQLSWAGECAKRVNGEA